MAAWISFPTSNGHRGGSRGGVARWLNSNLPRKRVTEVHELAQIVLPFADRTQESEEEGPVARFAGAFLLPEKSFKAAFGPHRNYLGVGELIQMKVTSGVSIWAMMKRAEQLGLISPSVYERFCIYAMRAPMEVERRTRG